MSRLILMVLALMFVFTLSGCGGGGGSSSGDTSDGGTSNGGVTNPVTNPVTYKLSIEGPISSTDIKGIEFELVLPAGVTLKHDPETGIPLPGIVEEFPSMPQLISIFSPETRVLKAGLLTDTGIGPGEFATVICDVPPGSPAPEVRNVKATGVLGNSTVTLDGVNVVIGT